NLADHLVTGFSGRDLTVQQYTDNLHPKLSVALGDKHGFWLGMRVIAVVLVAMLFIKAVSRKWALLGRFPLAFVVSFYAGLQINAVAQAELGAQIAFAARTLDAVKIDLNHAS